MRGSWCAGIVGMSMRFGRASRIFCCRVIWSDRTHMLMDYCGGQEGGKV